jgi:DNA-binding protein HU-beta
MTKADLVAKVQEKGGLQSKAEAERAVNSALAIIADALASGEKVTFSGFGTFSVSERKARNGRNPRTGKTIKIPASKTVKFSPGKQLKEAVQ